MMTKTRLKFFTSAAFLLLVNQALAQVTGTIHGNITDPSGASVAGARVTALHVERGLTRTVTTSESGEYVVPLLPVGAYSLRVEAQGFQTFRQEHIELTASENVRLDARLQVGAASDSIVVTADAPQVDSRSSVVGTLIDSRRVTEIPTNGRNVMGLAILLPGMSQVTAPQTFTGDRDGAMVAISGSRSTQNLFLFDGGFFNALGACLDSALAAVVAGDSVGLIAASDAAAAGCTGVGACEGAGGVDAT